MLAGPTDGRERSGLSPGAPEPGPQAPGHFSGRLWRARVTGPVPLVGVLSPILQECPERTPLCQGPAGHGATVSAPHSHLSGSSLLLHREVWLGRCEIWIKASSLWASVSLGPGAGAAPRAPESAGRPLTRPLCCRLPLSCWGHKQGCSRRQVIHADASSDASVGIKSTQRRLICSQLTGGLPRPRAHSGPRPLPSLLAQLISAGGREGSIGADSPAPAVQMPGRRRCRSICRAERGGPGNTGTRRGSG